MSNLVTTTIESRRQKAPSLFSRDFLDHVRSYWTGAYPLRDPAFAKIFGAGSDTVAGVNVTLETAFTFSAVFDAVNQISGDIAKLPLELRKRRKEGGSDRYTDSRLYRLLKDEPNPEMTSLVFRRTLTMHALTCKGGFAEIERDGSGFPAAFWPITPDRVEPFRDERRLLDGTIQYGPLRYKIDGKTVLEGRDMLHIHGLGYDGYIGFSVINKARQAIGLALAAEAFGASFFANGAGFGGILFNEQGIGDDEEKEKQLRETISTYQSSANKLRQFLLLFGQGWDFKQTGVNPKDSQVNELRDKQVEEVARFFNMPLHKLKLNKPGAVSYASVEMADLDYYKGCLLTWITLWEQELNRKVIAPLEARQQFIKHNANAFLRGDIKSRFEALGIARDKGIVNADEWRELEDMNPQEGGQGKIYLVQQAMVPADRLPALVDSQIKKNEQPKTAPTPPGASADAERAARAEALAAEARAEAATEREARTVLEASGQATVAQLEAATAREAEATNRAASLEAIAEEFRRTSAATIESLEAERDAAVARAAEADAKAEEAVRLRDAAAESVTARDRELDAAQAEAARLQQLASEAEARAVAAITDREAATLAAEEARRQTDEAVRSVALAEEVRAASEAALAEAAKREQAALVAAGAANDAAEELRATLAEAEVRTTAVKSLEAHAAAAVISAHRSLVVHVMRKAIERESDRARRAQGSTEKFRAWIDKWYDNHEALMSAELLPVVQVHLAYTRSTDDPGDVARSLAREHVEQSRQQLEAVLDGDAGAFAASLAQLLMRWDTERIEVLANRLFEKEIDYVRRRHA